MSVRVRTAGLHLSEDECAYLALTVPAVREAWRRNGRAVPPELDHALAAIVEVARDRVPLATSDLGSGSLPGFATGVSSPRRWLTTREVADRLGISTRGVVDLLQRERLVGEQQDTKSAWHIDPHSVDRYQTDRKEGANDRDNGRVA